MKAYTFTTRNVTASERDAAGNMVLRHLGNVTLTLKGMPRAEIAEWEWATDALNTRGIDEEAFRLTVNGWTAVHPEAGVVGLLLQGAGSRVHVEWYDPANHDYLFAAYTRKLRHGAAQIVNARQHAGHALPVDIEPEPYKAPKPVRPVWLENGTLVRYHGSLKQLSGDTFRINECAVVDECDHWDCQGYALYRVDSWWPSALHVRPGSVTTLDTEPACGTA